MKKTLKKNWKTSLMGIISLAGTAAAIYGHNAGRPDIAMAGQVVAGVFGGGGLVMAKDSNVTGGTVAQ